MQLSILDWAIVLGYLAFALGVGIYYSRRASKDSEEYYLAGRTLPWWVLGTSMVATTFAADTPLAITEMSRRKGIWENWFWWNWLLYGLLAVFLFARLWRRANVLTENELLEIRYSGKPAACLRVFKAGYFAILYNFIVMAWVINSMSSVMKIMLGDGGTAISQDMMIGILVVIAATYALLSGFWGVVVTDVVQFLIAMFGAVALAVIALNHVGGVDELMTKLDVSLEAKSERLAGAIAEERSKLSDLEDSADNELTNLGDKESIEATLAKLESEYKHAPKNAEEAVRLFPPFPEGASVTSPEFIYSSFFELIVLMTVMWWSNHSTDGGGYLAQRTMAAKNEKHALLANLWYNFANFALRTWPWIVVALVSMVMFEDLSGHEKGDMAGYPLVMNELLGPGLRGVLLVSFLAAFMSTIDTHLNWASSYLVHDIYRRFMSPKQSEAHYVLIGRILTIVLMVFAALIARHMMGIEKAWKFVMAMGGGIGLVLILRWFWWRINAWSEISALAVSVSVAIGFEMYAAKQTISAGKEYLLFSADPIIFGRPFPFHLQLLVIVFLSIIAWISATMLTKPEPDEKLREFYARVQPGGWWGPIADSVETTMPSVAKGFLFNFFAGLMFVWGGMFCIGYLIFQKWGPALGAGLLMVVGFGHIWVNCIRKLED